MQMLLSFLKLGFHWTLPRDCIVGTSLGGTTWGILEGFPGLVLSPDTRRLEKHANFDCLVIRQNSTW